LKIRIAPRGFLFAEGERTLSAAGGFIRRRRTLLPGIKDVEILCPSRFSKISLFLLQLYGQEILRYAEV
jgi:hypothetical protein